MLTIHLNKVHFFAYHGFHKEEALTGNDFEVSLDVSFLENPVKLDDISSTISYVALFDLVKQRMSLPTALLERIAGDIISEIHAAYPFVKRIKISIFKLKAPIPYLNGEVGISLEREYNE